MPKARYLAPWHQEDLWDKLAQVEGRGEELTAAALRDLRGKPAIYHCISRVVDRKASGARAAAAFNAATIGGANALGRSDLGRLAVGAKADIVIINLRTTRYGPMRDPINALVEYGSGADVETVIVDGEVVVENGRSTRINDDELFAQAEAGAKRAWDNWPARDWNGRSVEQIIPPAFPTRKV